VDRLVASAASTEMIPRAPSTPSAQRPVRVLHALTGGSIGGTERMVEALVCSLEPSRVLCEISLLETSEGLEERFGRAGVQVHALAGRAAPMASFIRLRRILAARSVDVVHLYGFAMSLIGRLAASTLSPRPRVIHGIRGLHLTDWPELDSSRIRAAIRLERATSGMIDRYVANSASAVEFLTERGLPRARFNVIPNGLDTRFWKVPPGVQREPDLVVTVANYRPVKRLDILLDALARLTRHGRRLRAQLVGVGQLREQLESHIDTAGLRSHVELCGPLPADAVRQLLSRAAVFVLPSTWEGMPVSVMEAMACGVPIVGTNVPGIRDLVVHGTTGFLVEPTPDALASAIGRILDDPALGAALGSAGTKRVCREFTVERMASQYEDLYRSLVDQ
jgi:glycosyltransferase involved in cell wall biosynthesis